MVNVDERDKDKDKGNPTVQIRLEPKFKERLEKRATEKGFVLPSGKVNLSAYFKDLALDDLLDNKLDGEKQDNYKIK